MPPQTKQPRKNTKVTPPAKTLEGRENQMVSWAFDQAEEELRNKTASSQVLTHFLKLGTIRAQYELEALKAQNQLTAAKTEALKSTQNSEIMFADAIKAMSKYTGASAGRREEDD